MDSNNDVEALNNFLAIDDQTMDQFSSMLNLISITESNAAVNESDPVEDNMDGILSYLESRENDIIRSNYDSAPDVGTFTSISQSIPERQTEAFNNLSTISNGGLPCLDVMLHHLQERETSLERSPEYSIELNMRVGAQLLNNQTVSAIDNRDITDSSENCSSEIPDNDRGAIIMNGSALSEGHAQNSQSDDLEIIELSAPEIVSNVNRISEFMQQPVNLRIDNFVSSECAYDSDKDIDESEAQIEVEYSHPYIPSFHNNDGSVSPVAVNNPHVPSQQLQMPNNDAPLPGEVGNFPLNSPGRFHLRQSHSNSRHISNTIEELSSETQEENDLVQPFELDSNFDYDNAQITPRLNHYNR